MGKQSQLKKRKNIAFSPQDWANFYLTAKSKRAQQFRLQLAHECIDNMTADLIMGGKKIKVPMSCILEMLPLAFVAAYVNLVGHTMVASRHKDFWSEISRDLLVITEGLENEIALKEWGNFEGEYTKINPTWARTWCYASLQQLAETSEPIRTFGLAAEVLKYGVDNVFYDAIPTHLVISSCVAQEKVIYQSRSLLLCYQEKRDNLSAKELWLVKKRGDRIYTTSTEAADNGLTVSDVRQMRNFIRHYQGEKISGRLCPGREAKAARICRSIGLSIEKNYAILEEQIRS